MGKYTPEFIDEVEKLFDDYPEFCWASNYGGILELVRWMKEQQEEEPVTVTGKIMCEAIAEAELITLKDGSHPTPEQIWHYSSSGNLELVFAWYEMTKCEHEHVRKQCNDCGRILDSG